MAQGVTGQWFIDLSVDGVSLNANPATMPSFQIINNIHQHLPSVKFSYKDASGVLNDIASIADGTPLNIVLGTVEKQYPAMNFITLGMPDQTDGGILSTFKGMLNAPQYVRGVADKFFEGNTSDVLKQMVEAVGLKVDVDPTNDLMTWLPISKTIASMARHITKHGWASDASCMLSCVTDQGVFRYKNLENIISGGAKKTFSSFGDGDELLLDWQVNAKTHFGNAAGGYGMTTVRQMMDGSLQELNKVTTTMLSKALPMANSLMEAVGAFGVRVDRAAMDVGNVHEKWADAIHQNTRIASTFAFDISILVDKPAFVDLLDLVSVNPVNKATGQSAANVAGDYIVTGVTKMIHGQRYWEKITLTSQGMNTPGVGTS